MTLLQMFLLVPAGILAGIVSTVAGLASLVSYPALLLVGLPPVVANMSNTVALVANGIGAVISSRRELRGQGRILWRITPIATVGGLGGGIVLLAAPSESFTRVVPFFIAAAALVVLFPDQVRALPGWLRALGGRRRTAAAPQPDAPLPGPADGPSVLARVGFLVGVFLTGAYGGYFGAAAGVLMMALLTATLTTPFAVTNAIKNTVMEAANAVAALLFLLRASPDWQAIVPLAIGMFVGGYVGPAIFRRLRVPLLRWLIGGLALLLATVLFLEAYFGL
ncbi:MAG: sulfite exporter TauE/SafE family protein [Pseudoclavibacter sp.]|jgi:uncharacterized membrane protein YfcA